jgi:hypothetical protein
MESAQGASSPGEEPIQQQSDSASSDEVELALAVGIFVFAAAMMLMVGGFHVVAGVAALLNDDFYSLRQGYDLKLDTTVWGWLHIVAGVVIVTASIFLLAGAAWARITTLVVAVMSCLWSFYSIPYYPAWSLVIIAVDLAVIWALVVHGRLLSE